MSHELEIKKGKASFAFNKRMAPWHRLGTPMEGYSTADEMLVAASANFHVSLRQVIVTDEDGQPLKNSDGTFVYVDDSRATVREDITELDGGFGVDYCAFTTTGTRYTVTQYREVLDRALTIVAANDEAVLDTMGVLYDGRQWFAGIKLGECELVKVNGASDIAEKYLLVHSSHDGKTPMKFKLTGTRVVCKNTLDEAMGGGGASFAMRHTKNNAIAFDPDDARKVLGIAEDWMTVYAHNAELMASVEDRGDLLDKVFAGVFPITADASDVTKRHNDETLTLIRGIYGADTNAGTFGLNGWSVYNAFTEWADWYSETDGDKLALRSLSDGPTSTIKVKAQQRVLAFA